jgi:hypothetical protein
MRPTRSQVSEPEREPVVAMSDTGVSHSFKNQALTCS